MHFYKVGLLVLFFMNGAAIFAGPVFSFNPKATQLTGPVFSSDIPATQLIRDEEYKERRLEEKIAQKIFGKLGKETPEGKEMIAAQARILYQAMKKQPMNEEDFMAGFYSTHCACINIMKTSKDFAVYFSEMSQDASEVEAEENK